MGQGASVQRKYSAWTFSPHFLPKCLFVRPKKASDEVLHSVLYKNSHWVSWELLSNTVNNLCYDVTPINCKPLMCGWVKNVIFSFQKQIIDSKDVRHGSLGKHLILPQRVRNLDFSVSLYFLTFWTSSYFFSTLYQTSALHSCEFSPVSSYALKQTLVQPGRRVILSDICWMYDVPPSSSQVGLFRKSGVKSRIQALRQMNEASGADGGGVNYEGQSAYDVADMLKQYFRDLPEPLLTSKLSETFLQIYQCKEAKIDEGSRRQLYIS